MSTGEVDKFEQTLIINQNYKLFQSGMLLLAQGRNSNFELYNDDDDDHGDDNDNGNVVAMLRMMVMTMTIEAIIMMTLMTMSMMTTWVPQ